MQQKSHVTCAVAIFTPDGVLLAHPTGSRHIGGWSFPKGLRDEGETELEAAVREVREETGLVINPRTLTDHGRFPYTREKDYHLFSCFLNEIKFKELICESTFEVAGQQIKEVDRYMITSPEIAIEMLNIKQAEIFSEVFKIDVRPTAGR